MLGKLGTEFENYRWFHERALSTPKPKTLVFSTEFYEGGRKRNIGGFADRLKGLISSAFLAMLTDRLFLADWSSPTRLDSHFNCPKINLLGKLEAADPSPLIVDAVDYEGFYRFLSDLQKSGEEADPFDNHSAVHIHTNIQSIGFFLRCSSLLERNSLGRSLTKMLGTHTPEAVEQAIIPLLFNYLLSYRPPVSLCALWNDFMERRVSHETIGVHFRSGGDGAWPDPELDHLDNLPTVIDALDMIAAEHFHGQRPQVYVASDSLTFRTRFTDAISNRYSVICYQGSLYHYERSGNEFTPSGSFEQSKGDGGIDFAVFEFFCFSRCDFILHGAGDFAHMAAVLGNIPSAHYKIERRNAAGP